MAGFADAAGRFLPLVCTLNATKVTEWAVGLAGGKASDLDRIGALSPPGSNGVVLIPYLDGERTPLLPHATGTLSGLRTTTTIADIVRASVEGVVGGLLGGVDALERCGVATNGRWLAVGGGRAFRPLSPGARRPLHEPGPHARPGHRSSRRRRGRPSRGGAERNESRSGWRNVGPQRKHRHRDRAENHRLTVNRVT